MSEFLFYLKMSLVSLQIGLCFIAAFAILRSSHREHNYFAGLVGWLWAGGMMAVGMGTLANWPEAMITTTLIKVALCGMSAGLAIYSGGSIFKVGRLCKKACGCN